MGLPNSLPRSFEIKPSSLRFGADFAANLGLAFALGAAFSAAGGGAVGATVCTAARSTEAGLAAVTTSSSFSSELVIS